MSTNNSKISSSSNNSKPKKNTLDTSIVSFISNIANSLTIDDITHSVETLEKIGPYLPEPYVEKVSSLVHNFEKINKFNELATFLSSEPPESSNVTVQNVSSKENFNKILLTLKDDMPEEKIKNIRPIIDIVANFDKYKGMIGMVSAMNSQSEKSEDKMENMMNMVMPLLGQNEESTNKMKDMMQIFKTISSSTSSNNNESNDFEDDQEYT